MKYITQISIILGVSLAGELAAYLIPLPIPGSIYGLVLLFALLAAKIVKLPQVKDVGDFLLTLMPIMFISPLVGLMESVEAYRGMVLPVILTGTVSTVIVMGVTGLVSQALIKRKEKKEDNDNA